MDAGLDPPQPGYDPAVVEAYLRTPKGRSAKKAAGGEPRRDADEIQVVQLLDLEARRAQGAVEVGTRVPPVVIECGVQRSVERRQGGIVKEQRTTGNQGRVC